MTYIRPKVRPGAKRYPGRPDRYQLDTGEQCKYSVSKFCSLGEDVSGLMRYSYQQGQKGLDPDKELESHGNFGSFCHDCIETFAFEGMEGVAQLVSRAEEGEYLPFAEVDWASSYQELAKIVVTNFSEFCVEHKVEIIACEEAMIDEDYMIGGTYDYLCYLDGKLTILDIKTNATRASTKWGIQCAAYANMIYKKHGKEVEQACVFHIEKKKGGAWFSYLRTGDVWDEYLQLWRETRDWYLKRCDLDKVARAQDTVQRRAQKKARKTSVPPGA